MTLHKRDLLDIPLIFRYGLPSLQQNEKMSGKILISFRQGIHCENVCLFCVTNNQSSYFEMKIRLEQQ